MQQAGGLPSSCTKLQALQDYCALLLSPFLHHLVQSLDALAVGAAEAVDGFLPGGGRVETGGLEGIPLVLVGLGIGADGARPAGDESPGAHETRTELMPA